MTIEPFLRSCVLSAMNGIETQFETEMMRSTMTKPLHAEDICVGDQVTIWRISIQCASFLWCGVDLSMFPPEEPFRVTYLPFGEHQPMVVKSICIPFVLCKHLDGISQVYDVRQVEFARLSLAFAESVKRTIKAEKKKRNKKEKKRRRKKGKAT